MKKTPPLGIAREEIKKAEKALNVKLPTILKKAWLAYNIIELRGGWLIYPIFDKNNPKKTCSHIVYENTKARWETMKTNLLTIAGNGTGNQLVLKVIDSKCEDTVYHWNHETCKLKQWKPGLETILQEAETSRKNIIKLQEKYGK